MPWSHRMIHGPSGAGTRSKTMASSSPFQRIQERPVSTSYEEVMTETVTTCLLNPRVTWQLSWERIGTWGKPWRRCVQRGDVLINHRLRRGLLAPRCSVIASMELVEMTPNVSTMGLVHVGVGIAWRLPRFDNFVASRPPLDVGAASLEMASTWVVGVRLL